MLEFIFINIKIIFCTEEMGDESNGDGRGTGIVITGAQAEEDDQMNGESQEVSSSTAQQDAEMDDGK